PGEDRRTVPARARPARRRVRARTRRVVGRRRGARRRGVPVLRRTPRRDDQDIRLPGEPDRGRGGRVRHRAGARRGGARRGRPGAGPADRPRGEPVLGRRGRSAERAQEGPSVVYGAEGGRRAAGDPAVAERQVRPQPAAPGVDPVNPHPTIAAFGRSSGRLTVGGVPVDLLAERVGGTPFFAYDRALLTARIELLRAMLPAGVELGYAVKANPMPAVVQHLAGLVDSLDVASALEMRTALDTTTAPERISFA